MATADELERRPPGMARIKAAHQIVVDEAPKVSEASEKLREAAWVLHHRHEWSKSRAASGTGMALTSVFPPPKFVEPSKEDILKKLPDWDEIIARATIALEARNYRNAKAEGGKARDIRRRDIAALYQGHLDGKLWEMADIGTEAELDTTVVKADLKALKVAIRPGQKRKAAVLGGPPAPIGDIARLAKVSPLYLRQQVGYWSAPERTPGKHAFPGDAAVGDGLFDPDMVLAWLKKLPTVASAPAGLTLRAFSGRIGENEETVKSAIAKAADRGTLPSGAVLPDGSVNEAVTTSWWQQRSAAKAEAASPEPGGPVLVLMQDVAADLEVPVHTFRYQVRKATTAGTLPPAVRPDGKKFDLPAARAWWATLGV
ncbi:hypothetical protein GCM10022252_75390 [Streptosporangium oxazolinicum]|uniref:Uncharacterized protein n=1 Tax=Streptosporangium oxazolinicum TaxID=909287 RepID=A0ABP8BKJ0_9ACTN